MRSVFVLLAALAVALAACNFDEGQCWAPGESAGAGVGGGVILPPQGGYGLEPDADPQGGVDWKRWRCSGHITECSNEKDPTVRRCLFMTSYGPTKEYALEDAVTRCEDALFPNSGVQYICEGTDEMKCEETPKVDWSCTGTPRCKIGGPCRQEGEVWHNKCPRVDVPVTDFTPEDARQQLLTECEDDLNTIGAGRWFCMPGTLVCVPDW